MNHCRDQRARQEITGQHRKDDRHRHRRKQESARAADERHRYEDDADAESRDKSRHRDLIRAVENGLHQAFFLMQIAMDVLDLHRCVVHKDAHGQRHAAECHHV